MKRVLSLFLVFLIVSVALSLPSFSAKANPSWLSGWGYRKSHVVLNATGADTNYQMRVTTHYGSTGEFTDILYVDAYGSERDNWTKNGVSPYLNDSDSNYIYTFTNSSEEGDYGFADTTHTPTDVQLKIETKHTSPFGNGFTLYLYDGSSWTNLGDQYPSLYNPDVYVWITVDVSAILDTMEKVNNAKVYFVSLIPFSGAIYIRRTRLDVTYVSSDSGENVFLQEKCRTDFGDVRFTDDDETTLLHYWMEEKVDSDYATFWVKVADDLSTENQTIYVYYGNPVATYPYGADQTEMDNTFLFADHFHEAVLDSAKWELEAGAFEFGDSCIEVVGTTGVRGVIEGKTDISAPAAFHCRARWGDNTQSAQRFFHTRQENDWNERIGFYVHTVADWTRCQSWRGGVLESYEVLLVDPTQWTKYEIDWLGLDNAKMYQDGTLLSTHTLRVPSVVQRMIVQESNVACGTIYVDWFFARKFVSPEPTHGDWGSEEESPAQECSFYGVINSQSTLTSQRGWIFGRYSSINPIASIDSQKRVSFSLFAAISQAFSISSLFSYFQTRNFFGSITQLFSVASKRTWIFNVQGLIQQVFDIQSYTSLPTTTLYMILGLISLALSCIATPLSIKKSKSAFIFILSVTGLVFALIAIALSNFATAALAFVLAIPALALSLIKREEQA